MKALQPTLKEKKRYINFELIPTRSYNAAGTLQALIDKLNDFLGVLESSRAGIMPVKYYPSKKKGILRTNSEYVDDIKTGFTFIKTLNSTPIILRSTRVSGTLNNAKEDIGETHE